MLLKAYLKVWLISGLANHSFAQLTTCGCFCRVDSCYTALATTTFWPSQAISDCRSFRWESVTVGAETVTLTGSPPAGNPGLTEPPNPTRTIPAYAGQCANSAAYASACECIGVTATGTTFIHLPTATVWEIPTVPDTSCGNAGLEVAIYTNPYTTFESGYSNFVPDAFKTKTPDGQSTTSSMGLLEADTATPDGLTPAVVDDYTLNYRGYFYAPATSTYTFSVTDADDIVLFWTGTIAQSGWLRTNENGESTWTGTTTPITANFQIDLNAGQYLPLRVMYANRGGGGKYTFEVWDNADPSNLYVKYGTASNLLVSHSCDGTAPAFTEAFGQET
ncbi:hypothetical protein TWF694_002744 [Orbilia ellipsospora]|uniref:PA14 domain-containing protein n=1 Tax=Orbilia ellipsospora TaxID=2528407 RepID=A0AAV9X402_9PEZI